MEENAISSIEEVKTDKSKSAKEGHQTILSFYLRYSNISSGILTKVLTYILQI